MDRRLGSVGPVRPEKLARAFTVYAPEASTTAAGRERFAPGEEMGTVRGVLARARAEERERYRQLRVEVSHVLIARTPLVGYAGCTLVMAESGRSFRVVRARDIGALHALCAYDCEEIV